VRGRAGQTGPEGRFGHRGRSVLALVAALVLALVVALPVFAAEEEPERAEPRSDTPGPQVAPQRRSLWRRFFGS
jgi:hypothetical protein